MPRETFTANELTYTISPETEVPAGLRTWALLQARLVDEITSQPLEGATKIQSPFSGISPRIGTDGILGFAGIPARAFPALRSTDYTVPVTIQAEGYVSVFRSVKIVHVPTFPDAFAPTDLGTLAMHRLPTIIAGRVALNTGTALQAIGGATITVTGIWKTPPPASLVVPPDPPDLISLTPGMYFDRLQAGTQIQGLDFQGAPGSDKHLLRDAAAGQAQLVVSDRKQIAAGDILAIDVADAERTEYITIQSVVGASTDDRPATVTLNSPLRSVHRSGAIVHKVQFQNVGAITQLTRDSIAGDVCLFLNGVGNLAGAPLISVQTGGSPTEFHALRYFNATSDAQGFFRLPPLSRVAQCGLHSHDGVHTDLDVIHTPDYEHEVSRLDFVYR